MMSARLLATFTLILSGQITKAQENESVINQNTETNSFVSKQQPSAAQTVGNILQRYLNQNGKTGVLPNNFNQRQGNFELNSPRPVPNAQNNQQPPDINQTPQLEPPLQQKQRLPIQQFTQQQPMQLQQPLSVQQPLQKQQPLGLQNNFQQVSNFQENTDLIQTPIAQQQTNFKPSSHAQLHLKLQPTNPQGVNFAQPHNPQNLLQPQQNLNLRLAEGINPQQKAMTPQQNLNLRPAEVITSQQNTITPHQNLNLRPAEIITPQQNLNLRPAEVITPQQNFNPRPAEVITPQQKSITPLQNLNLRPAEIITPQQNLNLRPAEVITPQQNFNLRHAEVITPLQNAPYSNQDIPTVRYHIPQQPLPSSPSNSPVVSTPSIALASSYNMKPAEQTYIPSYNYMNPVSEIQPTIIERTASNSVQALPSVITLPSPIVQNTPTPTQAYYYGPASDSRQNVYVNQNPGYIYPYQAQTSLTAVQAQPTVVQIQPAAVKIQSTAVQVPSNAVQVQPAAMQVQPAAVQFQPTALPVQPTVMQVQPAAVQIQPAAVQPQLTAVQAQSSSVISSQPSIMSSVPLSVVQTPQISPQYAISSAYPVNTFISPTTNPYSNQKPKTLNLKSLLPLIFNLLKERITTCGQNDCPCECNKNKNGNNDPEVVSGYSSQRTYGILKEDGPSILNTILEESDGCLRKRKNCSKNEKVAEVSEESQENEEYDEEEEDEED